MLRPVSRSILRSAQSSLAPARTRATRRFLSTETPRQKRPIWKNSAARWGLAIAAIYYYNTSEIFAGQSAEQPTEDHLDPKADDDDWGTASLGAINPSPEEASREGAFNEATGEINWDCPCLGGMADGPCGEEFRAAFSCFVFSEEDPKGMECIDKFQGMQNCFREHPEVYAAELEGDDNEQLEEGLEVERKELVKEIEERRKKVGTAGADQVQRKRLLEDDPPMDREPLWRGRARISTTSPPPPPSTSESHPPASEDHQADARLQAKPG